MATEQLELRTDNPLPRQMREQLMAEQMGIDALRNPGRQRVLFDELPQPTRRVGPVPRRFKQVRRPLRALACHILGELAAETLLYCNRLCQKEADCGACPLREQYMRNAGTRRQHLAVCVEPAAVRGCYAL